MLSFLFPHPCAECCTRGDNAVNTSVLGIKRFKYQCFVHGRERHGRLWQIFLFHSLLTEAEAKESGDARIVNHSSVGRLHTVNKGLEEKYFGKNGGNLGGNSIKVMGGACYHRYFQTKLANSVFTYGLAEKLKSKGSKVRAVCAHPGGSATKLADGLDHGCCGNCLVGCLVPAMIQSQEDGSMGLLIGVRVACVEDGYV